MRGASYERAQPRMEGTDMTKATAIRQARTATYRHRKPVYVYEAEEGKYKVSLSAPEIAQPHIIVYGHLIECRPT